ncbi:MAG: glutamate 5-kinase [Deltaproteobacteria bacterium]|nr:glutamate 5-kinase [Deltaproteobacteria bacterium]
MRAELKNKKRWVIKVGSSVLVDPEGSLKSLYFRALARQIASLLESKKQVVLVSSGAVAAGLDLLALREKPKSLVTKQAIAAAGQSRLMQEYEKAFRPFQLKVGQMLLTHEDLGHRRRFLNARHTLSELLRLGLIPIVNENDTVTAEEIKVGDNDNLAALVAHLAEADLLINLSDIDGVYEQDPSFFPQAKKLDLLKKISAFIKKGASDTLKQGSTGGMLTKLEAAEKAQAYGIPTIIANGKAPKILNKIEQGKSVGTLILPKEQKMGSKKYWIAYGMKSRGCLEVDQGAKEVLLKKGRSLLPSGICGVIGSFQKGDAVDICLKGGKTFARGLTSYHSEEIKKLMGHQSSEISKILGYKYLDVVVHRDDLVIF